MHERSDKRLIRFESIDEIRSRPSFCDEIPATDARPKEAIGVYRFPRDAREHCGLSNCRTPHMKGFLVAMESGEETLIGGHCGAKKMGLVFQEVINRAQRADRMQRYRDTILSALSDVDAFDTRLNDLLDRQYGARWIGKRMADCSAKLPSEAAYMIRRMAQRGEPHVYHAFVMTKKEIAIAQETGAIPKGQPGPYFRREKAGTLSGLEIWRSDLKTLLIDDLQQGMNRLKSLDTAATTSEAALRIQAQWVEAIPRKFTEAERLIEAGQAFFANRNLHLLKLLSTAEREITGLVEAIESLVGDTPEMK
jgi:hypothetical protein